MKTRYIVLATLSLTPPHALAQDAEWPGFRGPNRNGVAVDARPPIKWSAEENVAWKTELPGPGASSPIVLGEHVYVTCYSGYGAYLDDGGDKGKLVHHLVCVNRTNGKLEWKSTVRGPLEKDARRVQISEHGFASPTPVSDGKAIYAYFGRGGVAAFARDGRLLWKAGTGKRPEGLVMKNRPVRGGKPVSMLWGAAASPLLWRKLLIVNCSEESSSVRALDKKTGELVWKRESAQLEGSAISPVVVGTEEEPVLIIGLGGEAWGLDPTTGEQLWRVETGTAGGMSPTPVADERLAYVFGGMGKAHALHFARELSQDSPDGEKPSRVAWKGENIGIPSPILHEGKLFLVRSSGNAVCMRATDGKVLFNERLEGRTGKLYASPVLADGRLYVVTQKRGTFVYSADGKFKLLARNELDDETKFNASPAVAGEQLFLRSDKYLYCMAKS